MSPYSGGGGDQEMLIENRKSGRSQSFGKYLSGLKGPVYLSGANQPYARLATEETVSE